MACLHTHCSYYVLRPSALAKAIRGKKLSYGGMVSNYDRLPAIESFLQRLLQAVANVISYMALAIIYRNSTSQIECDGVIDESGRNYGCEGSEICSSVSRFRPLDTFCGLKLARCADWPLDRRESQVVVRPAALAGGQQLHPDQRNQ